MKSLRNIILHSEEIKMSLDTKEFFSVNHTDIQIYVNNISGINYNNHYSNSVVKKQKVEKKFQKP